MPRFRLTGRARRIALALAGLVLYQLAASITAPGIDGPVLGAYLRARRAAGGSSLLDLFDLAVGGGLSRGALLALGVMPYLSAWVMLRLARASVPAVRAAFARDDGGATARRWTRVLTLILALVQSAGFARFVQTVPGAVAHPGAGFVFQTMLVLTAGALAVMSLGEGITGDADVEEPADDDAAFEPAPLVRAGEAPALPSATLDVERAGGGLDASRELDAVRRRG